MSSSTEECLPRPATANPVDGHPVSRIRLLAVAVSVLAMVISFAGATRVSLWMDEAYTITVATRSLEDVWRMIHNIDVVHSVYNVLLHPWFALAGISEISYGTQHARRWGGYRRCRGSRSPTCRRPRCPRVWVGLRGFTPRDLDGDRGTVVRPDCCGRGLADRAVC